MPKGGSRVGAGRPVGRPKGTGGTYVKRDAILDAHQTRMLALIDDNVPKVLKTLDKAAAQAFLDNLDDVKAKVTMTPVEAILYVQARAIMRDDEKTILAAATQAAPYTSAKLSNVDINANVTTNDVSKMSRAELYNMIINNAARVKDGDDAGGPTLN